MQNTFSFTLRVEIALSPVDPKLLTVDRLEEAKAIAVKMADENIHKLKVPEKSPIAIKFVLDTNPNDHLYEAEDRVFLDELIKGSFKYVESYIEHIKSELTHFKALKKGPHKDDYKRKFGETSEGGIENLSIVEGKEKNDYAVYPMSYRSISKIVYRKNSPALANVHFQSSLNGDMQPPGTGKQP